MATVDKPKIEEYTPPAVDTDVEETHISFVHPETEKVERWPISKYTAEAKRKGW